MKDNAKTFFTILTAVLIIAALWAAGYAIALARVD